MSFYVWENMARVKDSKAAIISGLSSAYKTAEANIIKRNA